MRYNGGGLQRVVGVAVADAEEPAVQVILVFQLVIVGLAAGQLIHQLLQVLVFLLQLPPVENRLEEILDAVADPREKLAKGGGHPADMGKGGHQPAGIYRTQKECQYRGQQHSDDLKGLTAEKVVHAVSFLFGSLPSR